MVKSVVKSAGRAGADESEAVFAVFAGAAGLFIFFGEVSGGCS